MMVLVSYDVSTVSPGGQNRLRKIAKCCLDYGQRVQNSVFECVVDPAQWTVLKDRLLQLMNPEKDSLRFYFMGSNWESRVEHVGTKASMNVETDSLIL